MTNFFNKTICCFAVLFLLGCHEKPPATDNHDGGVINIDAEIAQIREQIKAKPDSSELHEQLSALAAIKGDWVEFENESAIAIRLDPNRITNYVGASEVYRRRGLKNKALEVMKAGVAVDPENPLSHYFLALLYEKGSDSAGAKVEYMETKRLLALLRSSGKQGNRIEGDLYYDTHGRSYGLLANLDAKIDDRLSRLK
jgi:protein involved in temperature-dependent protein secretion